MSSSAGARVRKFLVVVDTTSECKVALRYAARRAQHTGGRVTLLAAAAPPDFQQWRGVEEIMEDEAHAEAEARLHAAAGTVNALAGLLPELIILQGRVTDCVSQLLKEDKDISILVLAAGAGKEGPGPLVTMFAAGVQAVPVTIVPGNLTEAAIDSIA
ncbi:MAG: universal stress protein [Alphaproteobacteria bacterium]|jgi:nucleotide-binding universal stress UspA family protein|nr:universal stress protein [Alphaproteobacteria bacterium]